MNRRQSLAVSRSRITRFVGAPATEMIIAEFVASVDDDVNDSRESRTVMTEANRGEMRRCPLNCREQSRAEGLIL